MHGFRRQVLLRNIVIRHHTFKQEATVWTTMASNVMDGPLMPMFFDGKSGKFIPLWGHFLWVIFGSENYFVTYVIGYLFLFPILMTFCDHDPVLVLPLVYYWCIFPNISHGMMIQTYPPLLNYAGDGCHQVDQQPAPVVFLVLLVDGRSLLHADWIQ